MCCWGCAPFLEEWAELCEQAFAWSAGEQLLAHTWVKTESKTVLYRNPLQIFLSWLNSGYANFNNLVRKFLHTMRSSIGVTMNCLQSIFGNETTFCCFTAYSFFQLFCLLRQFFVRLTFLGLWNRDWRCKWEEETRNNAQFCSELEPQ